MRHLQRARADFKTFDEEDRRCAVLETALCGPGLAIPRGLKLRATPVDQHLCLRQPDFVIRKS